VNDVGLACALCGADPVPQLFSKDGIPYFRCERCGFVFARPEANANLANALEDYEPAYLRYLEGSREDERNLASLVAWAERFRSVAGQRVLDVGSGSGKLVRFLGERGAIARGIEPAVPIFERFLAGDENFACITLEELAATESGRFGMVFACDVLEHVPRPDDFLETLAALLEPDGVLIVSTPDVDSLVARLAGRHWHHYNRYHLSYLSRQSLRALAEPRGLEELACVHLPRVRSARYLLEYLAGFGLGARRLRLPEGLQRVLDGVLLPIDLGDILCASFRRCPS
jgi:SAM-dependent methyltransferase